MPDHENPDMIDLSDFQNEAGDLDVEEAVKEIIKKSKGVEYDEELIEEMVEERLERERDKHGDCV